MTFSSANVVHPINAHIIITSLLLLLLVFTLCTWLLKTKG